MEVTTGWTEGKAWEKAWGELRVGKERYGSDERVDGKETVRNSLARNPWGRSEMEATTRWTEGKPWVRNSLGRVPSGRTRGKRGQGGRKGSRGK